MTYDLVILGAGFAAAGLVTSYRGKSLIVERRWQAGAEFFGCLYPNEEEGEIHRLLQEHEVLFGTETVTVEPTAEGFLCRFFGPNGFLSVTARQVVDTRTPPEACQEKSFCLLVECPVVPSHPIFEVEKAKGRDRYLLRCPVPLTASFPEAREKALHLLTEARPPMRLILSATEWDAVIRKGYPKWENGILLFPSKAYATPQAALEAGKAWGKELQ